MKFKAKCLSLPLTLALLGAALAACRLQMPREPVKKQGFHMGTIISQEVYGESADKAADEVMKEIARLEAEMTVTKPGSEIERLNQMAGRGTVKLGPDSFYVLKTAVRYGEMSGGSFDVTVGPLVKTWGFFTGKARVPAPDEIRRLLSLVDYRDILLDEKKLLAGLAREGQAVDLGGIAKGYAGDVAVGIYKRHGIKSACLNIGGNVVALGSKPDGSPWRIGIQDPRGEKGSYVGVVKVVDKAVVTSGDYERFIEPEKGGKRYHHILDPATGYPADSGLISATIIADSSIEADALSTSVFILGLDKGMKLIESLNGVEAVLVTKDKKVYITGGLKESFTASGEKKGYEYIEKG